MAASADCFCEGVFMEPFPDTRMFLRERGLFRFIRKKPPFSWKKE